MKPYMFRITILVVLFLSQVLASPEIVLAEITEFTPSNHQAAALVLGQPDFNTDTPATSQSGMNEPYAVAVDPTTGKVFISDRGNNRVLRFASVGALINGISAEAVLGQADFVSGAANRGSSVAANTLNAPLGVFVDSSGRLWVSDTSNHRVLRFDNASSKANGASADGVLGEPNFTTVSPATTQNRMSSPFNVFSDTGGYLWVADSYNNRVLRFDNAAAKPNGGSADGVLGQPDFTSHTPATTQDGMDVPVGLFVDSSGRLWVSEYNNNRVLRFDNAAAKPDGANADGVLGQANFTSSTTACTQNRMNAPRGLGGDETGRLYVTDSYHHRVLIFEGASSLPDGANAHNVLGQTNFTTCTANAGGLSDTSLDTPSRPFYDPAAKVLWLVDWFNHRVLMYGNTAQPATLVLGQANFTSDIIATTQNGMRSPYGMRVDPTTGKVFVADQFNHRVLRFSSVIALANGASAEAVLGQADFVSNSVNRGGPVAANSMNQPLGVSLDSNGRLWVADTGNHRVLRFDNAAHKPNGVDADGVLGQPDFNNSTIATTQSGMANPYDVFVDSGGRLWVADYLNNRILRFDGAASKANGTNADGVLGQPNFVSNSTATTQNGMRGPAGVYVDLDGRLWVADRDNNRLLRFDNASTKSNGSNADGVLGQLDFISNPNACTQNGMFRPRGIGGSLSGLLYVADGDNNRVLIFENAVALPNGANASNLLGQPNFTICNINTGGISVASLFTPTRAFFDTAANVLWVSDYHNNRVLMYGTPEFHIFLTNVKR